MDRVPKAILDVEIRARRDRVRSIARGFGFVGRVEYRHVNGGAGGAQFGLATTPENDLLVVHSEAFDRDADPEDFSMEAIIAHERGHQILWRNERLRLFFRGGLSEIAEEVLASLVASLIVGTEADRENLEMKALFELLKRGMSPATAQRLVGELRQQLERFL